MRQQIYFYSNNRPGKNHPRVKFKREFKRLFFYIRILLNRMNHQKEKIYLSRLPSKMQKNLIERIIAFFGDLLLPMLMISYAV